MKESTKNNLKKFGKVTAYGLGLFAMLLLGVGMGNCSAKEKSVKAEAVSDFSLVDQKALSPKRALDPADYPTLGSDPNNMLRDAYAGHFYLSWTDQGTQGFRVIPSSSRDMYLLRLPAGKYFLDYSADNDSNNGAFYFLNDDGAGEVQSSFGGGDGFIASTDFSRHQFQSLLNGVGGRRYILTVIAGYPWLCLNAFQLSSVSVTLYDPLYAPSFASIDLGEYYNPLPIIGQTINDASIIVYPSAGSEVNVDPVDFVSSDSNRFYFTSSGSVFDGFRIELSRVMNVDGGDFERYATKSGDIFIAPLMSANYVTANAFYYRLASSQQWVKVWELPYNGTDKGYNYWSYNGRWLSSTFRYVEVKQDDGANGFSSWLPTFTLTDLLSLNVWTAGAFVLGDAYNNVFTMLGKGFESVGGILSIQILPYMTLGTLIFVPLVVLIIFAILRILNK